jgi:nicotinamidase-related amidase
MGKNSLLIIIDLQKGFITPCSEHVVSPIGKLQAHFSYKVFTKFYNPVPSPFRDILEYEKLPPGSAETELVLRPSDKDLIIDRPYYTCVTKELRDHIAALETDEAYICGIATEACVLKTVLDLFESNIRPWLIRDLCASDKEEKYHDMTLELIAKLIGEKHVIDSAEVMRRFTHMPSRS